MARRLVLSDHALVRFLERTGAMDVAAMKATIAATLERAAGAAAALDANNYLILNGGLVFVVREGVVVTVGNEDNRHSHARSRFLNGKPEDRHG